MVSKIRACAGPEARLLEDHAKLIHKFVVDLMCSREREAGDKPDPLRWMPWVDSRTRAHRRDEPR
ncbi:MAG TPA: hypothetical protein VI643_06145 [Planctomycetota bacterium]|nr:hypothetical protein [Planctomycetota bacterium]